MFICFWVINTVYKKVLVQIHPCTVWPGYTSFSVLFIVAKLGPGFYLNGCQWSRGFTKLNKPVL